MASFLENFDIANYAGDSTPFTADENFEFVVETIVVRTII